MLDCSDNGGNERYLAEQLVRSAEREDCYTARLVVRSVSPQDSDMYSLVVENLHGSDRFAIRLNVKGNSNFTKNHPFSDSISTLPSKTWKLLTLKLLQ